MYGMVTSHSSAGGGRPSPRPQRSRPSPAGYDIQPRGSMQAGSANVDVNANANVNLPPTSVYRRLVNLVKQAWSGVKFALEPEMESYEGLDSPRPAKPRGLESLCRTTKFSRRELKSLYRGFKEECPTGYVDRETLADVYARFFPQGANVSQYVTFVFKTFDHDRSGELTFEEFAVGLSLLLRGSCVDRLRWAFSLYDLNGDGCITKDEMSTIVASVYGLLGPVARPRADEATVNEHVDRVFQKLDLNQDGVVTIEEFVEFCTKDEDVSRSLDALDSLW